jgi:anti-sigma-K factor RskA
VAGAARWVRSELPFLLVVAAVVAAALFLAVEPGHWRRATLVMAIALLGGGAERLALPDSRAGLLAVRNRWLDAFCYLAIGGVILAVDIRLH